MDTEQAVEFLIHAVFWASVVSILLPPIELFQEFPRFQRYYKLVVDIINNYAALNLRGKIAQAYTRMKNGNETPRKSADE